MQPPPPLHHVFIDFENVPSIDLAGLDGKIVKVTLLLGEKQKRLDTGLVDQLLRHAAHVNFVRLRSSGKNALDFALAYYVGRAVATDPSGTVYIISRDKGFDPLVEHLNLQRITAARYETIEDLPFLAVAIRSAESDLLAEVIAHLEAHPASRPKRQRTLLSHLRANYGQLTESQAVAIVASLCERNVITIDAKGAVTYHVPNPGFR